MADMMTFPDTVEEFMEQYKITDTDHVYTNGADMVPIFRMKQWFEHQVRTQMSSADCISRQAAIDACKNPEDGENAYAYGDAVQKRLKMLPSAQPKWIPCSERLPDDVEIGEEYPTVIFCTAEGTVHVGGYEHYLGGKWWYMETWEDEAKGVIAWMPLPEPYGEES